MKMNIMKVDKQVPEHEGALRLQKLAESGVKLDKDLQDFVEQFDFQNEECSDYQNKVVSANDGPDWAEDLDLASEKLLDSSIETVAKAIEQWNLYTNNNQLATTVDVFRNTFLRNPQKVLNALCHLAENNTWITLAWEICLWELKPQTNIKKDIIDQIDVALELATDDQLKALNYFLVRYVKLIAKNYEITREKDFSNFWSRVWRIIDRKNSRFQRDSELLTRAINSLAGEMTVAALIRLWKYPKQYSTGLPIEVRRYFDEIAAASDGHYGRVILATELLFLYETDQKWTQDNLISRLSSVEKVESQELWLAYSSTQSIGPNLLAAIKYPFIEMLSNDKLRSDAHGHLLNEYLAQLFMSAYFYTPANSFNEDEKKRIAQSISLSEEMLESVLSYINERIAGNKDERAKIWRRKIEPWLNEYWPKSSQYNTRRMSEIMLEIIANCGSAYIEAAEWFMNDLKPTKGRALYAFENIDVTNESAAVTLKILLKVVDDNIIDSSYKQALMSILDKMKKNNVALAKDADFNSLWRIAES